MRHDVIDDNGEMHTDGGGNGEQADAALDGNALAQLSNVPSCTPMISSPLPELQWMRYASMTAPWLKIPS
jgi:hypothetical protein